MPDKTVIYGEFDDVPPLKAIPELLATFWQPIATAPQKLLFECLISNGKWTLIGTFIPRHEGDEREGPGWSTCYGDVTPTHWMPLPEKPR